MCVNLVTSTDCTRVDIGASANLEIVDMSCYLGDMLSVDEDADAAVEARIRVQAVCVIANHMDISLIVSETVQQLRVK